MPPSRKARTKRRECFIDGRGVRLGSRTASRMQPAKEAAWASPSSSSHAPITARRVSMSGLVASVISISPATGKHVFANRIRQECIKVRSSGTRNVMSAAI